MKRIQVRTRIHRNGSDPSLSLDLRDPDIVRAKAIARPPHLGTSVLPTLTRKEI